MRGMEGTGFDTLSPNGMAISPPPAVHPERVEGFCLSFGLGEEGNGFDRLSPNGVDVSANRARTVTPPAVHPERVEGFSSSFGLGEKGTGFDKLSPNDVVAGPNRTGPTPTVRPEPVEGPPFFLPFAARTPLALIALATLAACARQAASAVQPEAPGFLLGLWHGFIFPVAWLLSLFLRDVAIYAVPNDGGWYDFGYFLGIVVFGVGARKSHVVYRERIVRVRS